LQPNLEDIKRRANNEACYARDIASNKVAETLRLNQYAKPLEELPMHVQTVVNLGSPVAKKQVLRSREAWRNMIEGIY
jgi:hypothetical protein